MLRFLSTVAASLFLLSALTVQAQGSLVGLRTDGAVLEINRSTGALTPKSTQSSNFELGAIARKGNTLYTVAVPAGATERALYVTNLKTGASQVVDLDRNDTVSALFIKGRALYGIFSDDNAGTAGVYRINQTTGATTLVVDMADTDVDFIGGAIARIANRYYTVGIDYTNSRRALVEFKLKAGSAKVRPILTAASSAALCERIKPHPTKPRLVCLAATTSTQVDLFWVNTKTGTATFKATLSGIDRVGGGHTMSTMRKVYTAFVYPAGVTDTQTLITFSAAGSVRSQLAVDAIFVGARYAQEDRG